MTAFDIGARTALAKLASLDGTVNEVVTSTLKSHLDAGRDPSPGDELDALLPDDGDLEGVVAALEDNFGVSLASDVTFELFAGGTVADLESALITGLVSKTAAFDSHAYYMRNRAKRQQQSRQYRMRNLAKTRRRAKIYRRQVARGSRRRRKRMGSAAGGYTFVAR